jgi:hypothetical protein
MQIEAKVDAINNFPGLLRDMSALARSATAEGARIGGAAAASRAAQRGMADSIMVGSVSGSADGWVASFVCTVPHGWWQSFGTLGSRRRPLKQPPRTNRTRAPGTGITPLNFLLVGRNAGRRALLDKIREGLPR